MCSAASATIDCVLGGRLWENAARTGGKLLHGLKELQERYDMIGDVRGVGLMIGVEIVKDKDSKEPAQKECSDIRRACADRGLIVGTGGWYRNVIRVQPPLIIDDGHVDSGLRMFEEALSETSK